jgi:hypothetical protein
MLRPACKVREPPLPPALTVMGELTVMSLLACRTTAPPAFRVCVSSAGVMVTVCDWPRA